MQNNTKSLGNRPALELTSEFADLGRAFSQPIQLSPLDSAQLVHWNPAAAKLIGLESDVAAHKNILETLNGNIALETETVASLYAGHQFGVWVPQLGDGRAATLGQVNNPEHGIWEIQTKGGGVTPFSRGGDGRAVLRSSIREYLCSEAMHALRIPSSRALALIDSQTKVYREEVETGALVARMAPTHIRFGTFEVFASRNQPEQTQQLADFVIDHFYPDCREAEYDEGKPYLRFYQQVITRTAEMIAGWQAQGFAHGVMNTDNMSILGLTIDYGPFGFLESYDPGFICNHSDHQGRYAFDQQPNIGLWNLSCLGNALLSLIELADAQAAIETYVEQYYKNYYRIMFNKLGIKEFTEEDRPLLNKFLNLMLDSKADYSRCFRLLSRTETYKELKKELGNTQVAERWLSEYNERTSGLSDRSNIALKSNPKYILRNYIAQTAIDKAKQGDYSEIDRLMRILQSPFDEHPDAEEYFALPPDWAKSLSVSCSS